ncbi:MAG: chromosomal replication initiator protein DnaA [Leptolinea sp.]
MMNPQAAWQAALGQLQMEMPKANFDTWVRSTEILTFDKDIFTVGVQNAYARDWLETRLTSTVSRILTGLMDSNQTVRFVVWQKNIEPAVDEAALEDEIEEEVHEIEVRTNRTLNPRYSFDSFVVGPSNRLAHAASLAVAENPARAYNPLFLYGGVGLGKTHMLQAIGNTANSRNLSVLYVSSEDFTNDLINAIRSHNTNQFRDRYRKADVLLIDDIQFIAGKESTQEEFFHTFNALHGTNKQLVISSDRPPKAMVTLEDRLRSRFEGGLTVDIQPPDLETRMAILRSKAERAGRRVTNEIIEMIARQVQSNIRELEGALTRVLAFSDLSGLPLTTQLVTSAMADLLPVHSSTEPRQVVTTVARAFGITTEQILGRDRTRGIVLPRQVAMYLLREVANVSLPQIGQALGGRDHTTVMYACAKVADMIERDDQLRRQVVQLRDQLFGRTSVVV